MRNTAYNSLTVDVNPVAPTLTVTGADGNAPPSTVPEATAYTLQLSGTGLVTQWIVDWGDGSQDVYDSPDGSAVTAIHGFRGFGSTYQPKVTASDQYGSYNAPIIPAVTVLEVTPTVTAKRSFA